MIEISFCIPTYNKGKGGYLEAALDSILCQLDADIKDKVEICISDDASTDNTKEIIENYQKKYPNIKSFYFEKNTGAGRNYCHSISLASGKYIWFMGGDDIVEKDGIRYILSEIKKDEDIFFYLADPFLCFNNMTQKRKVVRKTLKKEIILDSCKDIILNAALDVGQISFIIFRKRDWDLVENYERFYSFSAPHFYHIWTVFKRGGRFKYLPKEVCSYRCENSFFAKDDAYKRFYILTAETRQIAEAVFGKNSWEVKEIDKTILREHIFTAIVFFGKLTRPHPVIFSIKAACLMIKLYGANPFLYLYSYKIIPALLCPAFILKFIKAVYRKIKK